jgi:serine/threonine-protein kinase
MVTPTTTPVSEGDVLAGKYVVEKVLGQGGMGVVVAARHLQLGSRVALKFVLEDFARDSNAIARFMREAQSATRISSEHVARVLDVGQLESGAPYMVMEYLEGSDLSKVVETRGALPLDETIDYVTQACRALAEAHGKGIIHRDIKPSNLFLTRRFDGSALVKVLDFGIAKMIAADVPGELTQTQSMMGSPLYASPEQLDSARHASERSDIWALGVTLHHLASGGHPFMADSQAKLIAQIMMGKPTPVREHRRDLPEGFENVVLRCLERDPSRRFQNVKELVAAFAPFAGRASVPAESGRTRALEGTAVLADPTPVFSHRQAGGTTMPQVADATSEGPRPRSRTGLYVGLAAGLAAAVAVALRVATPPVDDPPAARSATESAPVQTAKAAPIEAPAPRASAASTAVAAEEPKVTVAPAASETAAMPPDVPAAAPARAPAPITPTPAPPIAKKPGAKPPKTKSPATAGASPAPGPAAAPATPTTPKGVDSLIDERR